MTREQAINYLFSCGFTNEQVSEVVRALTYEPTTKNDLGVDKFDKAINQSDLEEWIMETFPNWCEGDVRLIMNHMDEMPSVTPQLSVPEVTALAEWIEKLTKECEEAYEKGYEAGRKEQEPKTGHWIDTDEWRETVDGFEQWGYFRKCSKCGYVFKFLEIDNYCPNCGSYNGGASNGNE